MIDTPSSTAHLYISEALLGFPFLSTFGNLDPRDSWENLSGRTGTSSRYLVPSPGFVEAKHSGHIIRAEPGRVVNIGNYVFLKKGRLSTSREKKEVNDHSDGVMNGKINTWLFKCMQNAYHAAPI